MTRSMTPYPHSLKTERALLGGVITDPGRLVEVADLIIPSDFYRRDHHRLWALLLEMHADGTPIDLVSVPERVLAGNEQEYGGTAYVLELPDHSVATSNLTYHAKELRRLASFRGAAEALESGAAQAREAQGSAAELLTAVKVKVEAATRDHGGDIVSGAELADSVVAQAVNGVEAAQGFSSGLKAFDRAIGHLYPTDLVIVAARPGTGKTALAAGIADYVQETQGHVAVFSMEMSSKQWMARIVCQRARVSFARWRSGKLTQEEVARMKVARSEMGEVRLHIDDRSALTIDQISARCARLESRYGPLKLVLIDYLQLMGGSERKKADRIGRNSKGAKTLAKDRDTTVMLLSQLNREVEKRQDNRPTVVDLRGSGEIEEDADKILFIYREVLYNRHCQDPDIAELIGAKRRNGPCHTDSCHFEGPPMLFRDTEFS